MYVLVALILLFGLVVFVGAPYLPTLKKQSEEALKLLDLKPGQTMLELGCGDGRVLRAAAQKGIRSIGYELNPILVIIAKIVTWKHRKNVQIIWGNYWLKKWPEADGIYVFLLDKYMKKLDKKIIQSQTTPTTLASYTFKVPGKKPAIQSNGIFLYRYE